MAVGPGKAAVQRTAGDAGNTQRKRRHPWRDFDAGLDRGQNVEAAFGCGKFRTGELMPAAGMDGNPIEGGTAARDRQEQLVMHRRVERRHHRAAAGYQRHRDSPVRKSSEIGARSVDRIDDPDIGLLQSRRVVLGLLRQPAGLEDRRQALPQKCVHREIGLADRRRLAFGPALELAAKSLQRQLPGLTHCTGELVPQSGTNDGEITGRQR